MTGEPAPNEFLPPGADPRLRVFDWNTPWFQLLIFYRRAYAQPWLEITVSPPHRWQRWRLNVWKREP